MEDHTIASGKTTPILPSKLIICLSQKNKTGKSATIRNLAGTLVPVSVKVTWHNVFNPSVTISPSLNINTCTDDICVEMDYKGKHIGLNSFGDNDTFILQQLDVLATNNCDIIFCACHTSRSATFTTVNKIA